MRYASQRFLAGICLFVFSLASHGEIRLTQPLVEDMAKAYGFYIGQDYSLDLIADQYPELAGRVQVARSEFNLEYKSSITKIKERITELNQEYIPEIERRARDSNRQLLADGNLTRQQAQSFLDTVLKRAEGDLDKEVKATFLMFNPDYIENPEAQFNDKAVQRHTFENHPKGKGIDASLKAPISWEYNEGENPNILVNFVSHKGHGSEMFMLYIKELPVPKGETITQAVVDDMLSGGDTQDFLPEGANLIDKGTFSVSDLPGFWMEYTMDKQHGRMDGTARMIQYMVYFRSRQIMMSAQVWGQKGDEDSVNQRFNKHEKLFDLMAASLIIPQRFK